MDAAQALELIKAATQIRYTDHALERMDERGVERRDVWHCLRTANVCEEGTSGEWRVKGSDREGVALVVAVEIEVILTGAVRNVVITIF